MATSQQKTMSPNFMLTPQQQTLLLAALNSNKPSKPAQMPTGGTPMAMDPLVFDDASIQAPGSGSLGGVEESPFIDYDYDFDPDGSFDFDFANDSQGQMIGKLPSASGASDGENDSPEKRSLPDDDDDEDTAEEGGGKRREGEGKVAKKPGRKPLTSEPSSKRKAQNRAAQRAFRERKEKHLKDLETKVTELEKASESANHENSILRAQVDKMTVELREYKRKLSLAITSAQRGSAINSDSARLSSNQTFGRAAIQNLSDVNFQFEFPKFGPNNMLPGNMANPLNGLKPAAITGSPASDKGQVSPRETSMGPRTSSSSLSLASKNTPTPKLDSVDISTIFGSPFDQLSKIPSWEQGNLTSSASRSSFDSLRQNSLQNTSSSSSPSASSNSNGGPSSSCGTSPEPFTQSPIVSKPLDNTLTTIGEENPSTASAGEISFCEKLSLACGTIKAPIPAIKSKSGASTESKDAAASNNNNSNGLDIPTIDWFAQQNGNQFDPQLFSDYREPQDNVLQYNNWDDSFFNDAFDVPDFNTPFNMAPSPAANKKASLIAQIDAKQNGEDEEVVPNNDQELLTCNNIWEKLQTCPKVQTGDFDLDGLCTQLQQKAKCSGQGAVVESKDFHQIMKTFVGDCSEPLVKNM